MTQHSLYVQCSLVNVYALVPALKLPGNSCEARFPVEKETTPSRGWQHHMWIHTDLWTQDALYLRKRNESEPEECGRIPTTRVFFEKNKECGSGQLRVIVQSHRQQKTQWNRTRGMWQDSYDARFLWTRTRNVGVTSNARRVFGRVSARHVLVEKRYGIWAGAGSIACEFTLTCEPKTHCTSENTRNLRGSLQHAFFIAKHSERGKTGHPWFLNLLSRWRGAGAAHIFDWKTQRHPWWKTYSQDEGQAHFTWENTTISPRSARVRGEGIH